jgi:hypothetical protein
MGFPGNLTGKFAVQKVCGDCPLLELSSLAEKLRFFKGY